MYIITVLFGILSVVLADNDDLAAKQAMQEAMLTCAREHNFPVTSFHTLKSANLPDTKDNKCFLKCLFVKSGSMDEAGNIKKEFSEHLKMVDADLAKAFTDCASKDDIKKDDPCDTAYALHVCCNTLV